MNKIETRNVLTTPLRCLLSLCADPLITVTYFRLPLTPTSHLCLTGYDSVLAVPATLWR